MSRSVSAPSFVTKTSPCWNGFIVPGSTFRYGSSFCMVTRRPRDFSRLPRLDAVSPLPSEEATPPVTNTCMVGWLDTKGAHVGVDRDGADPADDALLQDISTGSVPIMMSGPSRDDSPVDPPRRLDRRLRSDQCVAPGSAPFAACTAPN